MKRDDQIEAIGRAYREMKKRGWGFTSNGRGFGDPAATWTAVGPWHDGFVEVWGSDPDCVKAVEKAIAHENQSVS